jgi:hypothetical protein
VADGLVSERLIVDERTGEEVSDPVLKEEPI